MSRNSSAYTTSEASCGSYPMTRRAMVSPPGAAHLHVVGVEQHFALLLAVRLQIVADADVPAGPSSVAANANLLVAVERRYHDVRDVLTVVLVHGIGGARPVL